VRIGTEMYAVSRADPQALWDLVSDLWNLAAWTDADEVTSVEPEPVAVGTQVVTVEDGGVRTWRVVRVSTAIREIATDLEQGTLTIGFRVVRDPLGSRLILAAGLEPRRRVGFLRGRLVEVPALRRRLERWSAAALDAVKPPN
jgi:hypothetical protein